MFKPATASGFDPRKPIDRREKAKGGKKKAAAAKYLPPSKRRNLVVFKNVVVFKYMGPNSPTEFTRTPKVVVCTFFHQIDTTASGEEVVVDLVDLIKNADCPDHDFTTLGGSDLEFVKCSGKSCRIPQTAVEFEWNGEAVKSLCGQGDLCVRLRRDFSKYVPEPSDESDDTAEAKVEVYDTTRPHSSSGERHPPHLNSSSGSLPPSQTFAATTDDVKPGPSSVVDLTHTSPVNCTLDDDDELPPVLFSKPPAVSTDTLYNIFTPAFSVQSVDAIVDLCDFDTDLAMTYLVNGPTAGVLLRLLRKKEYSGRAKKITIHDEEDILEEALLHYKHPSFDPCTPVRVSLKGQPAVDTGGVTRQFFNDVLRSFVKQDSFQLFVGHPERLRPAYSPQVLPLMKILGLIIGHSVIHEGPGFPFFAPFVFWYLASGSEQTALPYVSVNDLSNSAVQIVNQVNLYIYVLRMVKVVGPQMLHVHRNVQKYCHGLRISILLGIKGIGCSAYSKIV